MIKKINIALAVVFVVLFGLKFLLDAATAAKTHKGRKAKTVVVQDACTLAPRIYYTRWAPMFAPNVITHHNGFYLDIIREVFPNAVFDDSKDTTRLDVVLDILRTDPNAVIAEYADMDELKEFPVASEQIGWMALCVYTPRTSLWKYEGVESLDKLRLGWTEDNNDSPVLRKFAEKWKNVPGKAVVLSTLRSDEDIFWEKIEKGELDGFVSSWGYAEVSREANDSKAFVRYRQSEPIDMVTLRFRASSVNPELSKKFCDAFDDGVHRLYHAGVIHRLVEYYRKDMAARGVREVMIPIDCYGEDQ